MKNSVEQILQNATRSEDLSAEFRFPLAQRYKRFILTFSGATKGRQLDRLQTNLTIAQCVTAAIGGALGFFLIYGSVTTDAQLTIWISYIFVAVFIAFTISVIPTDIRILNAELDKLRLLNLCERLAAQVALFDILKDEKTSAQDDQNLITQTSMLIPEFATLSSQDQRIVEGCLDPTKNFGTSRLTNIRLVHLGLDSATQEKLNTAVKEVVTLCGYIFSGTNFSAKIYLRARMKVASESVELLAPFSKYPAFPIGDRGSAWVKARGNPSIVWNALENGRPVQKSEENLGEYYSAVLAIPLPGRIGVLAITSNDEGAFKDKDDEIATRALAIAMHTHVLRTLQLGSI